MDLLLRNRSPENAYDAKILRDRQQSDRRGELLRHQREEELMRLNNAWYSKQSAGSPSTSSSPRPYGVLSDVKIASPTRSRRTSASHSPPNVSRGELGREGDQSSPQSLRGARTLGDGPGLEPATNRSHRNGEPRSYVDDVTPYTHSQSITSGQDNSETGRIFRQSTAPGLGAGYTASTAASPRPHENGTAFATSNVGDEYAAGQSPSRNVSRTMVRKAREFGGHQVARLLGGEDEVGHARFDASPYSSSNLADVSEDRIAKDLLDQIRWKEEQEKELRRLEMQVEIERVRSTLAEARLQFKEEDEAKFMKQQQAFKLIQESERSSLEAMARQKEYEENQERLAMLEREELEQKRAQEHAMRKAFLERKLDSTGVASRNSVELRLLEALPSNSPLQEAIRRLMEAHAHELEVVLPIIQDILNEPDFAVSPWL